MARPRGSKNKPKDGQPQSAAPSPGIGDNSGLTDEKRQTLTVHHKGRYVEALANKKKYDKAFKDICKLAVSDLGENAVDDIKDLISLETPEGEALMKANIERQLRIARWKGLAMGTQSDWLHQGDVTPITERAAAEGLMAGLEGKVCSSPYHGEAEQAWIDAWHKGQAQLAKGIKPMEPAPQNGNGGGDFSEALDDDRDLRPTNLRQADADRAAEAAAVAAGQPVEPASLN
jgi:hypothetical protein